jgi:hypothetical protein
VIVEQAVEPRLVSIKQMGALRYQWSWITCIRKIPTRVNRFQMTGHSVSSNSRTFKMTKLWRHPTLAPDLLDDTGSFRKGTRQQLLTELLPSLSFSLLTSCFETLVRITSFYLSYKYYF